MDAAHALNDHIRELFPGATEAVEEAIINTLLDADTTQGNGHVIPRLDAASQLFTLAAPANEPMEMEVISCSNVTNWFQR